MTESAERMMAASASAMTAALYTQAFSMSGMMLVSVTVKSLLSRCFNYQFAVNQDVLQGHRHRVRR
jgi:hypothetical protein